MNSNVIQMPRNSDRHQSQIDEEALVWLVELDAGLSSERKAELQLWLGLSECHRQTFLQQAQLWDELDVLSQLADILPYQNVVEKPAKIKHYSIAASIMVCLFLGLMMSIYQWQNYAQSPETDPQLLSENYYSTQKGEFKKHILPDGSVLTLNTDTVATVQFSHRYRNIHLDHGEVHIQVAHDTQRPLNIIIGDKMIQAVGTAFNVQYFNRQDVELIVSQGKVLLAEQKLLQKGVNFARSEPVEAEAVYLTAGQKVSFGQSQNIQIGNLDIQDISDHIDQDLSWLKGALIFSGELMEDAISQINRYLDKPIFLEGNGIRKMRVIGRYEQGKLDQFLKGLELSFHVNQTKNAQGQIVLSLSE